MAALPVRGRFMSLQASFDALAEAHDEKRWGDVPGEALLTLADPNELLIDAWPDLSPDHPDGRPRIARLLDQRHRDDNGLIRVNAVEPIIALLLKDDTPWSAGEYAQSLSRDWLHAHIFAETAAGHQLRVLLRQRLVQMCAEADQRLEDRQLAAAAARAARTPEEIEQERRALEDPRSAIRSDADTADANAGNALRSLVRSLARLLLSCWRCSARISAMRERRSCAG